APYWTLAQSPMFDITGLSTLAYFSIDVNGNGTLDESGAGWNGFESQDLVDLITRAHAAGERVVLTVNDFGQSSLDSLTSSPTAPATLSGALIPLLQAKSLLTSSMFSTQTTLAQYDAAVPASKVIIGTPFFGIDWPTNNGTMGANA